jgi:hypothetical protein
MSSASSISNNISSLFKVGRAIYHVYVNASKDFPPLKQRIKLQEYTRV